MLKGVKIFVASIFVLLCGSVPASALSVGSLEKVSSDTENIEILEPEQGYYFDANFLAKNQELRYKATIENDEEYPIKIESINLANSAYNFLEYSYSGILVDDVINVGESKEIIISVETNSNNTTTVSEDYNLTLTYSLIKPEPEKPDEPLNPETATTAVVKTGTIALISIGTIVFVFVRNKKIRNYAILFMATSLGVCAIVSNAVAEESASTFSILGKVRFTNIYSVTVDPNEGTYNGELTATRREGETFHIEEVTREHFEFVEWEINPSNTPDQNNDIAIHANTTLKAKWNENTYTLTIKPNGGKYADSEETWSQSYRPLETATISAPEKEGYRFTHWTVEQGSIGQDGSFSGNSVTMTEDITLVANYEIKRFTVTIIPDGGTYGGELTTTVDWNTDYQIQSISRSGYDLKEWTKTVGSDSETLASDVESVNIKADTTLEANWWSSTFFTVTIDPNGGVYDSKTEPSEYQVREGTNYSMLEVTKDNALFDYWHYTGTETRMNEEEFTVTENVSLTAEWVPIVAQIIRNGEFYKYYPSIMAAHEEAISGDTIELLVDTEEIVTNSKNITLDLGTHTVTGYLVNTADGNLRLINGEFNNYTNSIKDITNPDGAAAINNGTLTLGYDDYTDGDNYNKAPLIDNDYIRLVGSDRGLIQNNIFYFYDGHIDGTIGLVGGYDGSPWYRDTDSPEHEDTDTVYYYPFVSRQVRNETEEFQRVQLANSNRAVSRTIDHGAIYYYELQDNINSSAVTGYQIYAVRNFDNSAPITIPENSEIVFDTDGHQVDFGDTITNNGALTIKDGKTENKGSMTLSKSLTNNSDLTIQDITISGITSSTMIDGSNRLELKNARLESDTATIYNVKNSNETLVMDENSIIESTSPAHSALVVNADFEFNDGYVKSVSCPVKVASGKTFTLNDGKIEANGSDAYYADNYNNGFNIYGSGGICNSGTTIMNGGSVIASNSSSNTAYGVIDGTFVMSRGKIESNSQGSAYGFSGSSFTMSGGEIKAEASSGAYGVYSTSATITDGSIVAKSNGNSSADATALRVGGNASINGNSIVIKAETTNAKACALSSSATTTFTAGTATAISKNGEADGFCAFNSSSTLVMNSDDAKISAKSTNGNAYGTATYDYNNWGYLHSYFTLTMSAGKIEAITEGSNTVAIGADVTKATVTGGTIEGTTYGIGHVRYRTGSTITLGSTASPLYNGQEDPDTHVVNPAKPSISGGVNGIYIRTDSSEDKTVNFYDGIISGGSAYIGDVTQIKAIPDGTKKIINTREDGEDCWLEYDAPYLHVEGYNEKDFRSLGEAYEVVQDGGTIIVIADKETEAVLPSNTKDITLDLAGHDLKFTQPLINEGALKITDSLTGGSIANANSILVDNKGIFEMAGGTLDGNNCTVENRGAKTFTLSGGEIKSTEKAICQESASNSQEASTTITGGKVTSNGGSVTGMSGYGRFTMTGGTIEVEGTSGANGVDLSGTINITGGTISATGTGSSNAFGVSCSGDASNPINGTGVIITATTASGDAAGISSYRGMTFTAGTVTATSVDGNAMGYKAGGESARLTVNGDNAKILAQSTNGNAYGTITYNYNNWGYLHSYFTLTMSAGEIKATTEGANKTAIGADVVNATITGGTIEGTTYGVGHTSYKTGATITIGTNAAPLYNGKLDPDTGETYAAKPRISGGTYGIYNRTDIADDFTVNFYDGLISGGTAYIGDESRIQAIPDGTYRVIDSREDGEDCWLEYETPYLHVEGYDEKDFRSLGDAYTQVQDGGQITVIADRTTQAVLPSNTKDITLDLAGHKLEFTQPMGNTGTLVIKDSVGGGSIKDTVSTTISNSGTLTLQSGTIEGHECAVTNHGSPFNMTGGVLTSDYRTLCNMYENSTYAVATISGGKIIANGATAVGVEYQGIVKMSGGEVEVTGSESAYGIYSNYFEVTGGKITVTGTGDSGATALAEGGNNNNSFINGSSVDIKAISEDGEARAISAYQKVTFTDGTVSASSTNGEAYGFRASDYWNSQTLVMNGANASLSATSTNNNAYGASMFIYYLPGYGWQYGSFTINMSDGTITATTDNANKNAIGVNATSGYITGGTITGSSYGVGNISTPNGGTIRLGVNEEPVYNGQGNTANPVIEGGKYGVENSVWIYFYDGKITGGTDAIQNIRHIKGIADGTNIHDETVGGKDVKYLIPGEYIAKINNADCTGENPQCYITIKEAIEASSEGDTITLLGDDYVFYNLNPPAGKKFTLDLAGHTIITGNQITNNADMTIINSGSPVTIDYQEANNFITNADMAKLTIDGVNIKTKFPISGNSGSTTIIKNATIGYDVAQTGISSYGSLTLDNVTVSGSDVAVSKSNGSLVIEDSTLTASNYALDVYNATGTVSDTTLTASTAYRQRSSNSNIEMTRVTINGAVDNEEGRLVFDDCDITYSTEYQGSSTAVTNKGTMVLRNKSTITDNSVAVTYNDASRTALWSNKDLTVDDITINRLDKADRASYGITNSGSGIARISNSEINISGVGTAYALYNDNGTITSEDTDYNISNTSAGYGVYAANSNANTTMLSGSVNNTANTAYGAWIKNGALTLGEAEPLSSPNRGTANANVSTTSPVIKAVGSTAGYAVTLENGAFNYYDGKLVQNEQGFPAYKANHTDKATITNTEYWYEPEAAQDGDGNYYYILTYMPQ